MLRVSDPTTCTAAVLDSKTKSEERRAEPQCWMQHYKHSSPKDKLPHACGGEPKARATRHSTDGSMGHSMGAGGPTLPSTLRATL